MIYSSSTNFANTFGDSVVQLNAKQQISVDWLDRNKTKTIHTLYLDREMQQLLIVILHALT